MGGGGEGSCPSEKLKCRKVCQILNVSRVNVERKLGKSVQS